MFTIDEKINKILAEGFNIPFVEWYVHEYSDCYKILNPYTKFHQDKRVLCKVTDGFEKALDLVIENFSSWKTEV